MDIDKIVDDLLEEVKNLPKPDDNYVDVKYLHSKEHDAKIKSIIGSNINIRHSLNKAKNNPDPDVKKGGGNRK